MTTNDTTKPGPVTPPPDPTWPHVFGLGDIRLYAWPDGTLSWGDPWEKVPDGPGAYRPMPEAPVDEDREALAEHLTDALLDDPVLGQVTRGHVLTLADAALAWFAARPSAPTVTAERRQQIMERVQRQRFTDDDGNDVGTMRPGHAMAAVVLTLDMLGVQSSPTVTAEQVDRLADRYESAGRVYGYGVAADLRALLGVQP